MAEALRFVPCAYNLAHDGGGPSLCMPPQQLLYHAPPSLVGAMRGGLEEALRRMRLGALLALSSNRAVCEAVRASRHEEQFALLWQIGSCDCSLSDFAHCAHGREHSACSWLA